MNSTRSGKWLLFDLSSGPALQQTLAGGGITLTSEQAQCVSDAYAASGQPLFFALGIGVAGANKPELDRRGVLAHNNPNDGVLGNGKGIDHLDDSPILPALFGAAASCGVSIPTEG